MVVHCDIISGRLIWPNTLSLAAERNNNLAKISSKPRGFKNLKLVSVRTGFYLPFISSGDSYDFHFYFVFFSKKMGGEGEGGATLHISR